ncbi:MAG: hypothetical protein O3B01_01625 [Planctomycetota bacterium]|nr:hypothetical protein [Planctomycetota bacterium]MDA1137257.1 hypothetical protein [Planctomycetota bacterium]
MNRLSTIFLTAGILFSPCVLHAEDVSEAATFAHLQEALAKRLPTYETKGKPFREVMADLQSKTGINIVLDPELFEKGAADVNINLSLKNVSVKSIFKVILRMTGFIMDYRDEVLYVTTEKSVVADVQLLTKSYDVRAVISPLPQASDTVLPNSLAERELIQDQQNSSSLLGQETLQELSGRTSEGKRQKEVDQNGLTLVELIKGHIEPRSWATDNRFSISYDRGTITVTHTLPVHLAIVKYLKGRE